MKRTGWDDRSNMEGLLEFLAYFRGALMSYAKCFVEGGPGRRRLDEARIFKAKPDLLMLHSRIMDLRNKYAAHSDENELERSAQLVEETPSEILVSLQYEISFPFDRLYELRKLIIHAEEHIVDGFQAHRAAVEAKVGKPVRKKNEEDDPKKGI